MLSKLKLILEMRPTWTLQGIKFINKVLIRYLRSLPKSLDTLYAPVYTHRFY